MTTIADALRALSDLLKARAAAAIANMADSPSYWGGVADETFTRGVNEAVGGAAGHLGASFAPGFANTLADLMEIIAEAEASALDLCTFEERIYSAARELAERFPGLALEDGWPLAVRPRPEEPLEFGAKIVGWVTEPSTLTEWLSLGSGRWVNSNGDKVTYDAITVTEIPA